MIANLEFVMTKIQKLESEKRCILSRFKDIVYCAVLICSLSSEQLQTCERCKQTTSVLIVVILKKNVQKVFLHLPSKSASELASKSG